MRAEQTLHETAEETLARQAMALIQRSKDPLLEALQAVLDIPDGRQAEELRDGPHQDEEDLLFPSFNYSLDESDPDIVVLRRQDDTFVAAFSASGVSKEGIVEAAREDYWELLRAHHARQEKETEELR